jgi:hypothetical protein
MLSKNNFLFVKKAEPERFIEKAGVNAPRERVSAARTPRARRHGSSALASVSKACYLHGLNTGMRMMFLLLPDAATFSLRATNQTMTSRTCAELRRFKFC